MCVAVPRLQVGGTVLALAGAVVAVTMVEAHHWRGAHGKLGLAIMILACVQVLVLVCLSILWVSVVVVVVVAWFGGGVSTHAVP
eukprot:COSAG01_NODE_1418_length_10375_cov_38.842254_7_plen_84_part_00